MRATRRLMIVMGLVAGLAPFVTATPAGAGGVNLGGVTQVAANASMTCAVLQDTSRRKLPTPVQRP